MKNKGLKIGFDLDGVIIDHTLSKIKLAKERGYSLKRSQINSESMRKIIPVDAYSDIQRNIYGKEGLSSRPLKNAQKILGKIIKIFPNLYIISRRGVKIDEIKFGTQWLEENGFFSIFNKQNVFFVDTDEKKDMLCKKLGINIYIDDKIGVLNHLLSVKYRILFDINGDYYKNPPKDIIVVKSWDEVYKSLQKLYKMVA